MFLSSSAQTEDLLVLPNAPCFAILHYKGNTASSKLSLEEILLFSRLQCGEISLSRGSRLWWSTPCPHTAPQLLRPDRLDLMERTPDSQETWFISPPQKHPYFFAPLAGETPSTKSWSMSAHITTELWAKQKKLEEVRQESGLQVIS